MEKWKASVKKKSGIHRDSIYLNSIEGSEKRIAKMEIEREF